MNKNKKPVQYTTQPYTVFNVERYGGWGCILNCFIPTLFLCFLLIFYPYILLHFQCFFIFVELPICCDLSIPGDQFKVGYSCDRAIYNVAICRPMAFTSAFHGPYMFKKYFHALNNLYIHCIFFTVYMHK